MAEFVAVSFDTPRETNLTELTRLQQGYLIHLADAVAAIRQSDGKIGFLFVNLFAGFAAGVLLRAGTGAL